MGAPLNNKNAEKHGATGVEKRITSGLPLAEEDKHLRDEIISNLGPYDPANLSGPLGYLIDLIADNILLALRFRGARHYAAEKGNLDLYSNLSQRSGWRNDKAINQLIEFLELQKNDKTLDYEEMLRQEQRNNGE